MNILGWSPLTRDVVKIEELSFVDADDNPVAADTIQVALVPPLSRPKAATSWTTATGSPPSVILAGSAADTGGALVLPDRGADIWVKATKAGVTLLARFGQVR